MAQAGRMVFKCLLMALLGVLATAGTIPAVASVALPTTPQPPKAAPTTHAAGQAVGSSPLLSPTISSTVSSTTTSSAARAIATSSTTPALPLRDPCTYYAADSNYQYWWDSARRQISDFICGPTRWVDHFFAKPGDTQRLEAGTTLRVTQDATLRDDHDNSFPLKVSAHVELPNLEHRFKLLFVNDEDVQQQQRGSSARADGQAEKASHGYHSALRWVIRTSKRINLDADVGLRSGLHAYSRIRYRWRYNTSDYTWIRLTQKVYFRDPEGFSGDSLAEFNYALSPVSSARFSVNGFVSEENQHDNIGWVVSDTASYYYRLNEQAAIQYQLGSYAYTGEGWQTQNYRASVLYRRNIFRPWLFYEVEPFWEWPRDQDFDTVTGISLRIELLFGFYKGDGL